jgi:hypothetical protein
MSAPQIAGVLGILRSINPLVPTGADPSAAGTLRRVLASTTFEAQASQLWNRFTGYGHPDAAAAARKMLGKVAGATVRNRATPLFRLYSSGAKDYVDTTSPQMAVGLMINATHAWQPVASLPTVPNYPSFPHDPADGALAAPRASVYVMTTEYKPRAEWPALVPLYLMDLDVPNTRDVDDFMLVTTTTDIEYAHNHGYNLRDTRLYLSGVHAGAGLYSDGCREALSGVQDRRYRLRDIPRTRKRRVRRGRLHGDISADRRNQDPARLCLSGDGQRRRRIAGRL